MEDLFGLKVVPIPNNLKGSEHDAMVFADITDVGLIFVPSKDGISHSPEEWTDARDLANGVDVL